MTQQLAFRDHLRQLVAADRFTQRRLRAAADGVVKILDFEDALLGIPHDPEDDGIDIDGHGIARESGLGADIGDTHALIHHSTDSIENGYYDENSRPA